MQLIEKVTYTTDWMKLTTDRISNTTDRKSNIYLTIILRNRVEYRLILSQRGRRPSQLKSDDIPQDWAG